MAFEGFPPEAVAFYQQLSLDNSKAWWVAHKQVYTDAVLAPMTALAAELAPEFGEFTLFRPYRDTRFSADKSPYKEAQGGYAAGPGGAGYYVAIGPEGLFVAAGLHRCGPDQVARFRAAVDDDTTGVALERILATARRTGLRISGEELKTRPRGVPADHPRLDLMRLKSLTADREHGEPDWLAAPAALEHVRADWRAMRPLVTWLDANVGPTTTDPRR